MDPILLVPGIFVLIALILFLPLKGTRSIQLQKPASRFHEADAVLSRRLLEPGTESYEAYYRQHPGKKSPDDRSRQSPGLLSRRSLYYHPETFAAAHANFQLIEHLGALIRGAAADEAIPVEPARASRYIRTWLMKTGAHSVGFTPLRSYHLYSHKGRGVRSGERIDLKHTHAVAITVEMDHDMLLSAPGGTSVMESSEQYLRSGILALKLAAMIREMGYDATSHIDGNYELICPLVAMDAGLGVIGRMGLLMTPDLGPRVRISVVTTTLPLEQSLVKPELTTVQSCLHCKKCVVNCPAAAIPDGPRKQIDGALRWQIDSEKCYHFWTVSGTDCGRCMAVCPFSHRNSPFHNFVRWGIKNNLVFRHLALKLDDVFYGRKPRERPLPRWADMRDRQ